MRLSIDEVVNRLQRLGTASRAELVEALGASAATVYRRLQEAEAQGRVIAFGRGPATRYAPRGPLFGRTREPVPIHRVDAAGRVQHLAVLDGLDAGATLVRSPSGGPLPSILLGEAGTGYYDDLPFFLQDLRPQGFLGRQFARSVAGLPDNPERWSTSDIGTYLLDHAVDLPGDLLLGEAALERLRGWHPLRAEPADFPALAERVLAGDVPGSSAGGEQPKFAAEVDGRAVLVKFSPPRAESAVARRSWDLLVCEHLALGTLAEQGFTVASSRLVEAGGRIFLESERFDRTREGGRLPALSLQSVDAEFVGAGQGWSRAARGLARRGLLADGTEETIVLAEIFGDWIENTDQHLGNITLQPQPGGTLTLAPLYDILPMRHAPRQGEVPPTPDFQSPVARGDGEQWRTAGEWARTFWQRATADERLSPDFRALARDRLQAIEAALREPPDRPSSGPGW
ncbi:MAG: HipA domain-containing protein [Thiohalospira sp.]